MFVTNKIELNAKGRTINIVKNEKKNYNRSCSEPRSLCVLRVKTQNMTSKYKTSTNINFKIHKEHNGKPKQSDSKQIYNEFKLVGTDDLVFINIFSI